MKLTLVCREPDSLGAFIRRETGLTANALKRLKYREDGILVNGEPATVRRFLAPGDTVVLDCTDRASRDTGDGLGGYTTVLPRDLPLSVLYEDECVTVCDKPGDMPTHPVHGHLEDTAANALAYRAQQRGDAAFVFRPVNRLDRNTSGLFLCCNNFVSSGKLGAQLRAGTVEKTYLAILRGVPKEPCGRVNAPIARAEEGVLMRTVRESGSPAVTDFRVANVSPDGRYALAVLRPLTGRTHQIRVHMAHIGCPLFGDFLYGEESPLLPRHALHACGLAFTHPRKGCRMEFRSAMPADMAALFRALFLPPSQNLPEDFSGMLYDTAVLK